MRWPHRPSEILRASSIWSNCLIIKFSEAASSFCCRGELGRLVIVEWSVRLFLPCLPYLARRDGMSQERTNKSGRIGSGISLRIFPSFLLLNCILTCAFCMNITSSFSSIDRYEWILVWSFETRQVLTMFFGLDFLSIERHVQRDFSPSCFGVVQFRYLGTRNNLISSHIQWLTITRYGESQNSIERT